ncbi:OmpP1/FadL family transporter [Pseudobacteriovorax antillogorgiicola]|uniref:Long-chain fatty acid transport protein n=1 Tax=Pseudobacteriovorax antillogorgiicola TaxID=1513793 RepID=A0A1Y6C586_9BACT|nr:outer membrane protein transport protein [Pseudobacteriovorax antillogorgiicola]TCS49884.1 long-chain fatty acid transport protein [Pseudobacteriovorax antillogorgiicola]SMF44553.1 long-chain fatty acid transport protein [Pseudobacteriovorax antillogorgiicola]
MIIKNRTGMRTAVALGSLCLSQGAFAGGYQIMEKSTSDMGRAFSGGAAIAEDATTIGSNPAGMALLKRSEFSLSLSLVSGDLDVDIEQAGVVAGQLGLQGTDGNRSSGNAAPGNVLIPAAYGVIPINEQIAVGLGVFSNFSTATVYDDAFQGSILATESDVRTINFNPSVSYRVNHMVSLGFGFNAVMAEATLGSSNPALTLTQDAEGNPRPIPNGGKAGVSEVQGEDWGYGWNIGMMFELADNARIGVSYRSAVEFKLEGETKFKNLPQGLQYGTLQNFDANAPLELPQLASLSGYYEFVPAWALSADITYTGWSNFESLDVFRSDSGNLASQVKEDWKDSYRYALGLTHQYNGDLKLRTGLAYDQSPITDETRTLRIPTADYVWLSLGAQYVINDSLVIDGAYAKVMMEEAELSDERTFVGQPDLVAIADGKANLELDIFSIQLSYRL